MLFIWYGQIILREKKDLYITKQREEMASMSATFQGNVFDEDAISANEECNSHFDSEFLLKQVGTSESFDNDIPKN